MATYDSSTYDGSTYGAGVAATTGETTMLEPARHDWTIYQGVTQTEGFQVWAATDPAAPFQASSAYAAGDYVSPSAANGFAYLVVPGGGGTSGASEPAWPTVLGGRVTSNGVTFMAVPGDELLLDTSSYTARWRVRDLPGGTVLASGSTADGRAEVGFDPPKWATGTVYAAGQQVVPRTFNGWRYLCEVGGTSHATTEPTWNTTAGQVNASADNGVVWRNVGAADDASNLRIALVASYTDTLDFAVGWWQFDIEDAFGHVQPILWGSATLSKLIAEV